MSKQKKGANQPKEYGFTIENLIPEKYRTALLLGIIILLLFVFFSPVMFGDKTTTSGDLVQIKSMRQYALKEREGVSLWNPYIFCGMPAVVTSMSPRYYDLTAMLYSYASRIYSAAFKNYNAIYTFNLLLLAFTAFFFMRNFGASRGIAFITAVSAAFSTGIIVLFFIGHTTKLMSLSIFPFIMMMLFKFQKEIKILDVLLFIVGLHILVFGAHVQIVFYFGLAGLVYFIYYFAHAIATKNNVLRNQLFKSILVSIAAAAIALLMSYDTYGQLFEYKPYSTRGTESIVEKENKSAQSESDFYQYATNWSFSPGEVLTFVVPSYYGFGRSTYKGPLTNNQAVEVNTYFGQMPFVDTAMYMGVIVFALGIMTIFLRWKDPAVRYFTIVVLFFLLISFGRTFPVVYNFMYYYFPFFDNFRTPSMILHVIQIIFPVMAGLGLMKLAELRKEKNTARLKQFKNTALVFSGLFVFSIIFGGVISDWFVSRVNGYAAALSNQQQAQMFNALSGYMADMFRGDLQIAMALLSLTFGLIYAYLNKNIAKEVLLSAVAFLIIFDLFRIGNRGAHYEDSKRIEEMFRQPEYVTAIKSRNDKEPFRILNLKQDGSLGSISNNGNFNVYFLLEDFFGYSAVKPRAYQDIIDVVSPANVTLWRMANVKYIVTDRPYNPAGLTPIYQSQNTFVYENQTALPRLYFVDTVEIRKPIEILKAVANDEFDPREKAFIESGNLEVDGTDTTTSLTITSYSDEKITAKTATSGDNFLVFCTTYLPGWKAFVDGKKTETYKTNHAFIGIVVPEGSHEIEFIYKPDSFVVGKNLSLILNILLFASIAVTIIFTKKKKTSDKK
ncbi:MAG: YfhO family protein [Melioribacter sp.]|uniref:YfhO family protein n=1 Tax=Melioribacter sp. TaxID=2052167 RepID=UPI003BDCD72C